MIYDKTKIASLPHQRPEVLGVLTFRGKSISIVDLRQHLNIHPAIHTGHTELIVVTEFNRRTTGFVIDGVDRIERCTWEHFEPITDTVCNKDAGSLVGTVNLKDGIVVILDLETILSTIDPEVSLDHFKDQITAGTKDRANVSIVYCEDSPIVTKLLVKSLEDVGFKNIRTFPTGVDGFQHLESTSAEGIDIIISDIEMPKMDGLTLCKRTKSLPGYDKIPFIFFSSTVNEQMKVKCESVGGAAAFSKPEIHLLVNAIDSITAKKA